MVLLIMENCGREPQEPLYANVNPTIRQSTAGYVDMRDIQKCPGCQRAASCICKAKSAENFYVDMDEMRNENIKRVENARKNTVARKTKQTHVYDDVTVNEAETQTNPNNKCCCIVM